MSNEHHEPTSERVESGAESLLRRALGILGYSDVEELTAQDVALMFTAWLGLVQLATADPTSPVADLWGRIYDASLRASPLLTRTARSEEARESADEAIIAYVQRFPPRFEPVDRRTLDDIAAMREALDEQTEATARARDEADGLRAIADAAEERAEKAERELANLRALVAAGGEPVPLPAPDCIEPGQRYALTVESVDRDGDVWIKGCDRFLYGDTFLENAIYLGPAPTSEG